MFISEKYLSLQRSGHVPSLVKKNYVLLTEESPILEAILLVILKRTATFLWLPLIFPSSLTLSTIKFYISHLCHFTYISVLLSSSATSCSAVHDSWQFLTVPWLYGLISFQKMSKLRIVISCRFNTGITNSNPARGFITSTLCRLWLQALPQAGNIHNPHPSGHKALKYLQTRFINRGTWDLEPIWFVVA
jgi:hypothetical protein